MEAVGVPDVPAKKQICVHYDTCPGRSPQHQEDRALGRTSFGAMVTTCSQPTKNDLLWNVFKTPAENQVTTSQQRSFCGLLPKSHRTTPDEVVFFASG